MKLRGLNRVNREEEQGTRLYSSNDLAYAAAVDEDGEEVKDFESGARSVPLGSRVFYTADEVRSFRTLGLEPGECAA